MKSEAGNPKFETLLLRVREGSDTVDKDEARTILDEHLRRYRAIAYDDLRRLLKEQDCFESRGVRGIVYQIEIQAVWDNRPNGDLRVLGCIDDGRIPWCFVPLTDDFIKAPDGSFIGEGRSTIDHR